MDTLKLLREREDKAKALRTKKKSLQKEINDLKQEIQAL